LVKSSRTLRYLSKQKVEIKSMIRRYMRHWEKH
jgi:hypothetical protein